MNELSLCVFRSSDPALLAAWERMRVSAHAHHDATDAMVVDLGFPADHPVWVRDDHPGQRVTGFGIPESGAPDGWRVETKYGDMMVPRRSTKVGKAIQAKIDAIGLRPDGRTVIKNFGMPLRVFAGLRLMSPGVARKDDTVWVKWGQDPRTGDGGELKVNPHDRVDMDIWTQVMLSEFVLMVEAGNDPWEGE